MRELTCNCTLIASEYSTQVLSLFVCLFVCWQNIGLVTNNNIWQQKLVQSDCNLKVYLCKAKDDTSITPSSAWSSGLADSGNVSAITQLNQFPSDTDLFNDLWSSKVAGNFTLSPGQTASVSHTVKNVEYDPSLVDTHNLTYQKEYKAFTWMFVVSGVLSHDTTLNEQGMAACGVDFSHHVSTVISYDAGTNIKYVHVVENLDTPTNGFVQSHQPVPDNISYSVA